MYCRPVEGCCRSFRLWMEGRLYGAVVKSDLDCLSKQQCAVKSCRKFLLLLRRVVAAGWVATDLGTLCLCRASSEWRMTQLRRCAAVFVLPIQNRVPVDDAVAEFGWLMVFLMLSSAGALDFQSKILTTGTLNFSSAVLFFLFADRWYHIWSLCVDP
ncbi:hypothetical protein Nepgr_025776 [Nepenthes gracilis]|uniref:Uncharacterized protein n=1 Tax=Nepenthes gracilis TaxID=150966 RepID=A0AAD3T6X3_NEPGR|nr:hypothetical protein Nepgr_025776 [Nepenthes gracilis]